MQGNNIMKYKVEFRETTIYSGYIEMSKEEYKKLCEGDRDIRMNKIRISAIFPNKSFKEELGTFHLEE